MSTKLKIILIVFLLVSVPLLWYSSHATDRFIEEINRGYKGIVIDKFFLKTIHYKIKINLNETLDVTSLSSKFMSRVEVGDTIEKLPTDNYVLLHKKGIIQRLPYLYIDNFYRNNRRWPEEWKDKWKAEDQ